jgi:hypothetical protein
MILCIEWFICVTSYKSTIRTCFLTHSDVLKNFYLKIFYI